MIELLAPAGSMESLTAALRCGASAVYVGARQFSARAHAENFDAEGLGNAAAHCHLYGAKLYLAVNTLIFDREFAALDALLETAAEIGADGCIVQDLGAAAYIAKRVPTLRLHASTQLTVHSPAGVRFAKQAGFCRVVTARELSAKQLQAVCEEANRCGMELEAFVHGAHCMSVSGQCWMSAAMGGRSANRGCCAQPCRLPFTANPADRSACMLSLKDQSLVRHIPQLIAMGVTSLKIEGRMKRPEYVAAAVTACRRVLAGEQHDLRELQAVFSRSGFTDGYLTGNRQSMFGTRQKSDVLAAQDVLDSLKAHYRKPRKCAVLNAHFQLQADVPSRLTLTDESGHRADAVGDIPQTAKTRPTDLPQLKRQFEKLGDTVYTPGNVTAELDAGLMLPAAACNALRRDAVAAMDACRIRLHTPQHRLEAPPDMPAAEAHADAPKFRVQIRRREQLAGLRALADRLDALLLPLHLVPDYRADETGIPVSRCILVPPRFVCDEPQLTERLKQARNCGFSHLACGHVGDIALGKALGFTLHGAVGLHAANAHAASMLHRAGLADALCSPEAQEIPAQILPLGVFAYGKLPLMLTRNCPIQAQIGCARCKHTLTDRRGASIYTDCTRYAEQPDYAELFNAVPVWLCDRPAAYRHAAYALLFMTDESAARVQEILTAYLDGEAVTQPERYTRGLSVSQHAQSLESRLEYGIGDDPEAG